MPTVLGLHLKWAYCSSYKVKCVLNKVSKMRNYVYKWEIRLNYAST